MKDAHYMRNKHRAWQNKTKKKRKENLDKVYKVKKDYANSLQELCGSSHCVLLEEL